MKALRQLLRRIFDAYPGNPLVYVCSHNGVTGVVRAEDFDDEIHRMRKQFKSSGRPLQVIRPQVYPVFLFSDKTPSKSKQDLRVGTLKDLTKFLNGTDVEERAFELPPINAGETTPYGYFGEREGVGLAKTRHQKMTLDYARLWIFNCFRS